MIEQLTVELNELKLNEILKQEEFERQNKATFVADSISKAEQRRRIDSLRNILPGDPLVIEGDTLFKLYAKRGGHLPAQRVKMTEAKIMMLGKRLAFKRDSLHILDSDYVCDIMSGDDVIITITDNDGLWQNTTRNGLAEQYLPIIENKIADLQAIYGLKERIKNTLLAILVIVVLITAIFLVVLMYRYFKRYIRRGLKNKFKPIIVKDYELLSPIKFARVLMFFSRLLKFILILLLLLISIPILFSIFPETDDLSRKFFSYITTPLSSYWNSFVKFLPDLIKIFLLIIIFRYILKGIKYLANEIASSKLKINGFYPDWAMPTYQIIRILLYAFLVIMIWPLIPFSNSTIFQGVSVFIGLIISLGSTSVVGNLMAGMVITYMRSFNIGDQIKMNDIVGTVVEKTPFVTRFKTLKNEIVTVPNSSIMSSQIVNYTTSAKSTGVIIYSDVTVGYEVPWQKVEEILLSAAAHTQGVMSSPKPFVLIKELPDPYCKYQINAYTREDKTIPRVYTRLHKEIIDRFNEAGIELMSPIYYAGRDGSESTIPPEYLNHTALKVTKPEKPQKSDG